MRAVQLLTLSVGWELTHVRDMHEARTPDETWMPRFAAEGGHAFLSADRKMLGRPHQIAAIAESGLIAIFLSSKWAEAKRHEQAANIIWWWPRIESTIASARPKQCFRVPIHFGAGTLEEIRVDYVKSASKRTR